MLTFFILLWLSGPLDSRCLVSRYYNSGGIAKRVAAHRILAKKILNGHDLRFDTTSMVTGLGIGGITFGLAAQATMKNIIATLMLLIDQPFTVGDYINIGSGAIISLSTLADFINQHYVFFT